MSLEPFVMDYKCNHFLMFLTFQYRGLDMYYTLIIEAWLKSNIHSVCRYLEL